MSTADFDAARDALSTARAEFESRLMRVAANQWDLPTPCEGWTVRDLTAHLIGGANMTRLLLDGAERDEALSALFALTIDGDPVATFQAATDAQTAAFAEPGAADALCHHPLRDMPGSEFIWLRVRDTTAHAWDLARALGVDETLNADLVASIWAQVEPIAAMLAQSGMFGGGMSGDLDDSAPIQQRLLDALGRRP